MNKGLTREQMILLRPYNLARAYKFYKSIPKMSEGTGISRSMLTNRIREYKLKKK